jgi:hypothetical protein
MARDCQQVNEVQDTQPPIHGWCVRSSAISPPLSVSTSPPLNPDPYTPNLVELPANFPHFKENPIDHFAKGAGVRSVAGYVRISVMDPLLRIVRCSDGSGLLQPIPNLDHVAKRNLCPRGLGSRVGVGGWGFRVWGLLACQCVNELRMLPCARNRPYSIRRTHARAHTHHHTHTWGEGERT